MANNFKAYEYFIGFKFSDLEFEEQAAVRKGMREGYLRIEPGTRIVRAIPQPDPALPVHNGRHWA
jgi:hypothetical protein